MAEGGVVPKKFHLNCSICLETFKRPKLLPCYHTFCVVCLEKYIDRTRTGNKFSCPLCRKPLEVPKGGAEEFQCNFYIDPDNVKEETVPCEGCTDNIPADHRCFDCEENFCPRCTVSHSTMKVSRHHRMVELQATDPSVTRKMKVRTFCNKHLNEEIKVVCKQCNELLCVLCMLTNHQGHKSREVTEEAAEARGKLRSTLNEKIIEDILHRQSRVVGGLNKQIGNLKSARDREVNVLRNHGTSVKQAVDNTIRKMEEKLVKEYDTSLDKKEELVKLSETFGLSFKSLVTTANHVADQATDVDIIEQSSILVKELIQEADNDPLKNIPEKDVDGSLFTTGAIDTNALQNMIGRLCGQKQSIPAMETLDTVLTPIKDKLVKVATITAPNKASIDGIAPISNGRAWVCYWNRRSVEQIDETGKAHLSIDCHASILSVAADRKDNCIIGCSDRSIKRVTTTGKVEIIVSRTEGDPQGVAYRRKSDGTEEVMFCTDVWHIGSAVFVAPYRVSSKYSTWSSGYKSIYGIAVDGVTNKVCVADRDNKCVTVLDESGNVLSEYRDSNKPFHVHFDASLGILVTNNNSSLPYRRIRPDGTLMETLTDVNGWSVAIDKNNHMWVGKKNGVIELYELR